MFVWPLVMMHCCVSGASRSVLRGCGSSSRTLLPASIQLPSERPTPYRTHQLQTRGFQWPKIRIPKTIMDLETEPFRFGFKSDEDLDRWVPASDSDINGRSRVTLERTERNTGLFKGYLSLQADPKNTMERTGYVAMRTKPKGAEGWFPNLFDNHTYDLSNHDAIEIKLRGDGRTYICNVSCFTHQPEDMHQAFLYTQGGPKWETVKVPFDSFFLTNRGYLQDTQMMLNPKNLQHFGILLADRMEGPFSLEIAHIQAVSSQMRGTLDDHGVFQTERVNDGVRPNEP